VNSKRCYLHHYHHSLLLQKLVQQEKLITQKTVQEALDMLRGAVMIVYPMGLPPHDVIRKEFENNEDLSGTQASLEVSRLHYRDR